MTTNLSSSPLPRRSFLMLGAAGVLTGCVTDGVTFPSIPGSSGPLSEADAAAGIRAALNNGVGSAISTIGVRDGFLRNPQIRIPLPRFLQDMQSSLARLGLSGPLDTLETQLNRGAETAVPRARSIFIYAIKSMSINDAIGVVRSGENAATNYLKGRTFSPLANLFTPIMSNALQETGAVRTLDALTASLKSIPLAPQLGADAKTDLIRHGVQCGLDGMFLYIAKEEAAIRSNPAKRTSEILRRVFG